MGVLDLFIQLQDTARSDYYVCLKYGFSEILMPVDDGGCYDESIKHHGLFRSDVVDEFVGMHIFKANEKILELLGKTCLASLNLGTLIHFAGERTSLSFIEPQSSGL